ncbi:MAG TPA: hypothetical protein VNJ71_00050 [Gemmatimonadales bacterium]|jgi:drug/metabolite transporter (DMT)-like permease|nr:hypothetical protein [Gemmatimonadales bacterium]
MRWQRTLVRILGWLLTPLVAWAASFLAAWAFLRTQRAFDHPWTAIALALAIAVGAGVAALLGWLQLLRRSPRLRHSLHVDRAGLPVVEEGNDAERDR